MPSGLHNDCIIPDSINPTHLQGFSLMTLTNSFFYMKLCTDGLEIWWTSWEKSMLTVVSFRVLLWLGDVSQGQGWVYLTVGSWVIFSGLPWRISAHTHTQAMVKQPDISVFTFSDKVATKRDECKQKGKNQSDTGDDVKIVWCVLCALSKFFFSY